METLTPEQIKNWRQIIFMQLEQKIPGAGAYAIIMPEAEVIAYWEKMKSLVSEIPVVDALPIPEPQKAYRKPKCDHSNSISGQNGTYCLDCERYV
jgi:hypothetical protein